MDFPIHVDTIKSHDIHDMKIVSADIDLDVHCLQKYPVQKRFMAWKAYESCWPLLEVRFDSKL